MFDTGQDTYFFNVSKLSFWEKQGKKVYLRGWGSISLIPHHHHHHHTYAPVQHYILPLGEVM